MCARTSNVLAPRDLVPGWKQGVAFRIGVTRQWISNAAVIVPCVLIQIMIRLPGSGRGVSVLGDLVLPVTTSKHGTAFDIAELANANVVPARNAFTMSLNSASNRVATDIVITGQDAEGDTDIA